MFPTTVYFIFLLLHLGSPEPPNEFYNMKVDSSFHSFDRLLVNLTSCLMSPMNAYQVFINQMECGLIPDCPVAEKQCPNKDIKFYLYTRETQDSPYQLSVEDSDTIIGANFIPNAPIKFLIHGYTGHRDYSPNMEIRPAYFKRWDLNVISIDYGKYVKEPCYLSAVKNTAVAANCSAQLIDTILDLRPDIKLEQFHIIGLSLGGQTAGQIAEYFKHGQFERITGLDPALPMFFNFESSTKMLSRNDAKFVDVIHSNAGWKGKLKAIGNVDFYANSGSIQPGCGMTNTSCSHVRSAVYYAESINSKTGFWSAPCQNLFHVYVSGCEDVDPDQLILAGEFVPKSASGIYYFETNDKPPFALGKAPFLK